MCVWGVSSDPKQMVHVCYPLRVACPFVQHYIHSLKYISAREATCVKVDSFTAHRLAM